MPPQIICLYKYEHSSSGTLEAGRTEQHRGVGICTNPTLGQIFSRMWLREVSEKVVTRRLWLRI